jgi:hypothetical protein
MFLVLNIWPSVSPVSALYPSFVLPFSHSTASYLLISSMSQPSFICSFLAVHSSFTCPCNFAICSLVVKCPLATLEVQLQLQLPTSLLVRHLAKCLLAYLSRGMYLMVFGYDRMRHHGRRPALKHQWRLTVRFGSLWVTHALTTGLLLFSSNSYAMKGLENSYRRLESNKLSRRGGICESAVDTTDNSEPYGHRIELQAQKFVRKHPEYISWIAGNAEQIFAIHRT